MAPSYPFIDPETGGLDTDQILAETYPLAGLVALFGGVALVPFLLSLVLGPGGLGVVFSVVAQFVLAVGTGVVLMYVVARGISLTDA